MYFLEQVKYIIKNKNNKKEIKKIVIGFSIAIVGLILLILTLVGSTSTNEGVSITTAFSKNIANILLEKILINFLGNIINKSVIFLFCYITLTIILIYQIYKQPKNTIMGIVAIIWEFLIFLFIYSDFATQKTNTIFLVLVFIFWINLNEKEINVNKKCDNVLKFCTIFTFTLFLLISDINGLQNIESEITKKYSDSIGVAEFINTNVEDDAVFLCTNIPRTSAIIPYVKNATFINPLNLKEFTYVTWDETAYKNIAVNYIIENIKKSDYNEKNIYLIENLVSSRDDKMIKELQNQNILSKVLYESDKENVLGDEVYKMYKINLKNIR